MALAAPHPEVTSVAGLATRVRTGQDGTNVAVRAADGTVVDVALPGWPDRQSADHVAAGYRRLVWQRIDLHRGAATCHVRGVRHRLPAERPISLEAALALAERGLPTLVRVGQAG
jgi:hypothetical protein